MNAADYHRALAEADAESDAGASAAQLPIDPQPPGPTPWDPALQPAFDRKRRVMHQERLLPILLYAWRE